MQPSIYLFVQIKDHFLGIFRLTLADRIDRSVLLIVICNSVVTKVHTVPVAAFYKRIGPEIPKILKSKL